MIQVGQTLFLLSDFPIRRSVAQALNSLTMELLHSSCDVLAFSSESFSRYNATLLKQT